MKAIARIITLSAAVLAFPALGVAPVAPATDTLVAGAGKADITPAQSELRPGDRILDHLYARAIMVGNGSACAVLAGVDQGGLRDAVASAATARIARTTGCAPENIIISATHTHSSSTGGLGRGEPGPKKIEDAIVAAAQGARSTLRPARIGLASTNVDLNINRDLFVDNRWVQGPNPQGPSDKTLAVLEFIDDAGLPIGVYMNYAMHPVDFYLSGTITADFAGEASRYVERRFKGSVAVFAQGASGDQNPRLQRPERQLIRVRTHDPRATDRSVTQPQPWAPTDSRNAVNDAARRMDDPITAAEMPAYEDAIENTREISAAMGTLIGESAIQAMHDLRRTDRQAVIAGAGEGLQCPGRDRLDAADPIREGAMPPYADGAPVNLRVGMLRLGNIYIATVNGEVYSEIAMRLKQEAPVSRLMMTTLANGMANSGYIYSNAAGSHLTFQVIGSRLKPMCAEDAIVQSSLGLLARVNSQR